MISALFIRDSDRLFHMSPLSVLLSAFSCARIHLLVRLNSFLMVLTDLAILVDVGCVKLFELFDQGTQCVLRQFQLLLQSLDPVLDGIGFAVVAIHQACLYDFPKNAHFSPRFIVAASNVSPGLML